MTRKNNTHTPSTTPCSRCQTPILEEDFEQGLALRGTRTNPHPVCKICVDAGENTPQSNTAMRVNLQQQNIERFTDKKNPHLNRYTFLTATHLSLHRRIVNEQGAFNPPEYVFQQPATASDDEETASHSSAHNTSNRGKPATERTLRRRAERQPSPSQKTPAKISPQQLYIGAGIAAVLLVSVFAFSGESTSGDTLNSTPESSAPSESTADALSETDTTTYTRASFSTQPHSAWRTAVTALKKDDPLLQDIAHELIAVLAKDLLKAASDLDMKHEADAHRRLKKMNIPDHPLFAAIHKRKNALKQDIDTINKGLVAETISQTNDKANNKAAKNTAPIARKKTTALKKNSRSSIKLPYTKIFSFNCDTMHSKKLVDAHKNTLITSDAHCTDAGISKKALYLPAHGTAIIRTPGFTYPDAFTLSFHLKSTAHLHKADAKKHYLYHHGAQDSGIHIFLKDGLHTHISDRHVSISKEDISELELLDGNWHHYLLTYNKESGSDIYIDGEHAAQLLYTMSHDDLSTESIGIASLAQPTATACSFDGYVDNVELAQGQPIDLDNHLMSIGTDLISQDDSQFADMDILEVPDIEEPPIANTPPVADDDDSDNDNEQKTPPTSTAVAAAPAHSPSAWEAHTLTGSEGARSVVTADFNGDGFLDILWSKKNDEDGSNTIFFNDQKGGFSPRIKQSIGKEHSGAMAVGDFQGDGLIDALCVMGETIKLYQNTGSTNERSNFKFRPRQWIRLSTLGCEAKDITRIIVRDMNNDQAPDIVVFINGHKNAVFYNTENAPLDKWDSRRFGTEHSYDGFVYDINGDGAADIIELSNEKEKGVHAYLNADAFATAVSIANNVSLSKKSFYTHTHNIHGNNTHGLLINDRKSKSLSHFIWSDNGLIADDSIDAFAQLPAKTQAPRICTPLVAQQGNDFITVIKNMPHIITADGHSGAISSAETKNVRDIIVQDFNNDGLKDCLFINWKFNKKKDPMILFLRKTADEAQLLKQKEQHEPTQQNTDGSGKKPLGDSARKTADPLATSIFPLTEFTAYKSHLRTKPAYDDASTPVFDKPFRAANGSKRYLSNNKQEMNFFLSKKLNGAYAVYNASTGGIILTMNISDDRHRLRITVINDNDQRYEHPVLIQKNEHHTWQYVCIDLRNATTNDGTNFNASTIQRIHITPSNDCSGAYTLSTLFICEDGSLEPSIVPVMSPHPFPRFSAQDCNRTYITKKFNPQHIAAVTHPILFNKSTYNRNLSDPLRELITGSIGKKNSFELGFDQAWIERMLIPILTGKKGTKPSILLVIGMGMHAAEVPDYQQARHLAFWKLFIDSCQKHRVLPIVYTGSYPAEDTRHAQFDDICDAFIALKRYGKKGLRFPVIDIRGHYLTKKNAFKTGHVPIFFNRIAAGFHNFTLRCLP